MCYCKSKIISHKNLQFEITQVEESNMYKSVSFQDSRYILAYISWSSY
jgi:hypothetical protein